MSGINFQVSQKEGENPKIEAFFLVKVPRGRNTGWERYTKAHYFECFPSATEAKWQEGLEKRTIKLDTY